MLGIKFYMGKIDLEARASQSP